MNIFSKDSPQENLEGIFYDVIDYINKAINKDNGKVFVHCFQGVSRSVTICLAFIMFNINIKFEDLLNSVKKVRGICNPNMGFTVQLMNWYDRL